jgi:hypothetical protein
LTIFIQAALKVLHEAGMPILAVNDMRETLLACDTLLNFDRAEIAGAFAVLSSVALGDDGATAMHEQRSAMDETSALLHGFMCNTPTPDERASSSFSTLHMDV